MSKKYYSQILKKPYVSEITIPENFIAFDTETYPNNEFVTKRNKDLKEVNINKHILSFGYAFTNRLTDFDNATYKRDDEFYFETKKEFTAYVLNHIVKGKTLYVYAHNIGYDFRVSIDNDMIKDADFKLTTSISKNVFIYKYTKKNYAIAFISSTNYFRQSLKDLGKIFKLEKLDFAFDVNGYEETKNKSDRAKTYCFRDVEILEKVLIELFRFSKDRCKNSFTIASMAFNIFLQNFYDENIVMHKDLAIEKFERLSYYGGRTECFKIGNFENIYKLDINSMYPKPMKEEHFPVTLEKHLSFNKTGKYKNSYTLDELKNKSILLKNKLKHLIDEKEYLVIAYLKVNIKDRKIPYRDVEANKLLYPIGVFDTYLCQPEIEMLNFDTEILEVYEIMIYTKAKIFESFVDEYYNLRMKYKKEKDDVMQHFCKIILNSLYGKFAQNAIKEFATPDFNNMLDNGYMDYHDTNTYKLKIVKGDIHRLSINNKWEKIDFIDLDILNYPENDEFDYKNDKIYNLKFINNEAFVISDDTMSFKTFVSISSFVTSYSRRLIYSYLKLVEKFTIYMDTDSLFVTKEGYEILLQEGYIDNSELGKLKLEGVVNKLSVRNLKDYTLHETKDGKETTEYKIKGIKKQSIVNAINNHEDLDSKLIWEINRIIGYNESLRYFNLIVGDMDETKTLTRKYEKGIVDKDGNVSPFTMNKDKIPDELKIENIDIYEGITIKYIMDTDKTDIENSIAELDFNIEKINKYQKSF